MDLMLSGEIAKHIFTMTKKDAKLAQAMAQQFLSAIDPGAIAGYLLTADVARRLLAERIKREPERTLRELQALTGGGRPGRRGRTTGRRSKGPEAPLGQGAAAARGRRGRRRHRMSSEQVAALKEQVRGFLARGRWANRRELSAAVPFPSLAAYNRIMGELRNEGIVRSKGEKSKTVYGIKRGGGRAPKAPGLKKGRGKKAKVAARKTKAPAKPAGKAKAKAKAKGVAGAKITKRAPRLCPVPGCKNPGAPAFGMMCKVHKDIPKVERDRLFAARREAAK
jgi:hypothetical protein